MKYSSVIFGIVGSLLIVTHAHAEQGLGGLQLYEKMHALTAQEMTLEGVNDSIISYVVQMVSQENIFLKDETAAEIQSIVKAAFDSRLGEFCQLYNNTFDGCPQAYQMFRDWGRDILETLTLSTDLLHIATGYETGVSGRMGEIFTVAERTLTIRNLWRSQDDALLTPEVFPLVRAVPRPDSVTDGMLDDLGAELERAGSTAVWRYRYGITPFSDYCYNVRDASELYQAIRERYCKVEDKLRALRDALPASVLDYDPPLQRGEIVIFPLRRLDTPAHAVVWMMAEHVDGTIKRDVGLGWDLTLSSPSVGIMGGDPCDSGKFSEAYCTVVDRFGILPGGRYEDPPQEPGEDDGICHLAFARDGYMCRPLRHDRCNAEIDDKDPRAIVLTECKPTQAKQPIALTESGPDICRTGWWRIPSKELMSPQGKLGCSLCTVDIECKDNCPNGNSATTEEKDENGVIHICVQNSAPRIMLGSSLLHELVHAQQYCNLKPGTKTSDTAERCCATEAEAYRVSCRVYAEDGILDAIGFSLEECIGGLSNISCRKYGEKACSSLETEEILEKLLDALRKADRESGGSLPSCEEVIGKTNDQEGISTMIQARGAEALARIDSRIPAMIEALNGACTPGCPTKYENTIGNNLCYIGQCVEQSIEQSRVIPGRMGLVVEDEAFPWDSCAVENTQAAGLIALPAISPPLMPAYNPRLLIESLDRALCQINGLPAATPPILCQFNYERRLNIPTDSYVTTSFSFAGQIEENLEPTESLQRMTQSIATRIGTSLLTRYLSWAGRALSDTLRAGNELMGAMAKTQFPQQTCPRNAAETPDFCNVPYVPE
ncbi:MAG: hypothetical protein ABIG34_01055 [Candidatus Peregrinibacteria bacterium]